MESQSRGDGSESVETPAEHGACRVQSVLCGRCGWPSASVTQQGMRVLSFVCHWCGMRTVGIVDPDIKRNVIF
jgi:hypothetical protein